MYAAAESFTACPIAEGRPILKLKKRGRCKEKQVKSVITSKKGQHNEHIITHEITILNEKLQQIHVQ